MVEALPGGVFGEVPREPPVGRLARFARRQPPVVPIRTAFVLAGGGSRGAAQIGMLAALVDRGLRPDVVYGASVGAVNAAGYVVDPTVEGVSRLAAIWRGLTSDDVFPHGRVPAPWRFLQQRESVHSSDGIRKIVEQGAGMKHFDEALIPLEVVATSLSDGRPKWFTKGPAEEAILASAALPALLPPVRIDGELYIDGGVVDNVPISRAIEQGCRRIFVLLCGPLHYAPLVPRRPIEGVLSAFFIAVHARFAREREHLPPGVEVIVFSVGTEPISRYDDFSATEALLTTGRANADAVLEFWLEGGRGEIGVAGEDLPSVPGPAAVAEPAEIEHGSISPVAMPPPPSEPRPTGPRGRISTS
jgi:NTE family protein